jgi:hypothetical protein
MNLAQASAAAAAPAPLPTMVDAGLAESSSSAPPKEPVPPVPSKTMRVFRIENHPPKPNQEKWEEPKPEDVPVEEPVLDGEHVDADSLKLFIASIHGDPTTYVEGPDIVVGEKAVRLPSYAASVKLAGKLTRVREFSFVAPDFSFLPSFICRIFFIARMHDTAVSNWKMVFSVAFYWRWIAVLGLFLAGFWSCFYWSMFLAAVVPLHDILTYLGHTDFIWKRRTMIYSPSILASLIMTYSLDVDSETVSATVRQRLRSEAPALPLDGKIISRLCDDTERLARWYISRRGRGNGRERSSGWLLGELQPSCPNEQSESCEDGPGELPEDSEDRPIASTPMVTSSENLDYRSYRRAYREARNSLRSLGRYLTARGISVDCLRALPDHLDRFRQTVMTLRTSSKASIEGSLAKRPESTKPSLKNSESLSEDGSLLQVCDLFKESPISRPGSAELLIPKEESKSSEKPLKPTTSDDHPDGCAAE